MKKLLFYILLPLLVQDELTYYFDRHNVQDEGYEMVAAFAQGQRLEVELDTHLSAFDIGTASIMLLSSVALMPA